MADAIIGTLALGVARLVHENNVLPLGGQEQTLQIVKRTRTSTAATSSSSTVPNDSGSPFQARVSVRSSNRVTPAKKQRFRSGRNSFRSYFEKWFGRNRGAWGAVRRVGVTKRIGGSWRGAW